MTGSVENRVQPLPEFRARCFAASKSWGNYPRKPCSGQPALSPNLFEQERVLLTTEELFALHRALEAGSDDPALGLKLGTEERVERYDPIAIAALYARSFRDALQRMARYKRLSCPEAIHVVEQGDECRVQFEWLLAKEAEPALLPDIVFAWVVEIARRGTGNAVHAKQVEFSRSERHRAVYEGRFQVPGSIRGS